VECVSAHQELGITMVSVNNADIHVLPVLINGPVPLVLILELQPKTVHVHKDTMKKLDYQLVMLVLSDVLFVKEIMITVLNVLILD
jgi:hypothetical protein